MCKLMKLARLGLAGACLGLLGGVGPGAAQENQQLEEQLARDLTVAQKPVYQLTSQIGSKHVDVDAWVDNPGLTYAIGQPLHVMVRPRQDAYITVVDVGSSGRVAVLYPNHYQRDARVRAGSTVMIPSYGSSWQINVSGPAGVDLIQVIASRHPLSLRELTQLAGATESSPFVTLGRSGEEVARDLVAQLKPQAATAEAGGGVRNLLVRVVATGAAMMPMPNQPNPSMQVLLPAPAPQAFGLSVRTDKPVYRVGEAVRVIASAQHDCRLTLINVSSTGHAVQLFPNMQQRENLLRAGEIVMIPSPQSSVQYVAHTPAGVEGIVGVCRDESMPALYPLPAGNDGSSFLTIGTAQSIGRDLAITPTASATPGMPPKAEQASASYLVVE